MIGENLEYFSLMFSISFLFLASIAKKRQIRNRRNKEMLRIEQAYEEAGISFLENRETDALGFEIAEMRFETYEQLSETAFEKARKSISEFAAGQCRYHSRRLKSYRFYNRIAEITALILTVTFFICVGYRFFSGIINLEKKAGHGVNNIDIVKSLAVYGSLLIPPLFAAIEAFKFFNNLSGNIKASKHMLKVADYVREKALTLNDQYNFFRLAILFRNAYNTENVNWKKKNVVITAKLKPKP